MSEPAWLELKHVDPTEEEQEWFEGQGYGRNAGRLEVRSFVRALLQIRPLLERAGIHLVTEKDAAVLEAMSAIGDSALRSWIARGFETVLPLAKAELARREAFHSGEQSAPESAAAAENTLKTR